MHLFLNAPGAHDGAYNIHPVTPQEEAISDNSKPMSTQTTTPAALETRQGLAAGCEDLLGRLRRLFCLPGVPGRDRAALVQVQLLLGAVIERQRKAVKEIST